MDVSAVADIDAQYRQLREECGLAVRADRAFCEVSGEEAAEYLQGQITNDVESLEPGQGAYAALLTHKARIQADLRALRTGPAAFLLETDSAALPTLFGHLDKYRIGRDVEVRDAGGERAVLSVIGPAAARAVGAAPGPAHAHRPLELGGVQALAVSAPLGELPGIDLICAAGDAGALRERLAASGVPEVSEDAAEILRVEAGVPRFGREITAERMPAEAGIVEHAVSFTKGCYIGQEPVARLHYRGRPNRQLRELELTGSAEPGSTLELDGREVGTLTSFALSPARGPVGLGVLRKEAEPGASLRVGDGEVTALVAGGDPGGSAA